MYFYFYFSSFIYSVQNTGLIDSLNDQICEILGWLPIDPIVLEAHGTSLERQTS